uniref:MCAfunc domain-containing protein n=1 Tax=Oryza punctata TaxID=4537 RepID=A0A0E0MI08_ORYPU
MADPVGIVGLVLQIITDIVPKIMEEVDRVRQNKKECLRIKGRAERISHTLSPCKSNVELMEHLDASEPLRALGDILREALNTVTDCQAQEGDRSAQHLLCFFCRARKISNRLQEIAHDIADMHADVSLAILVTNSKPASFMVYQISKHTQDTNHPPRREIQGQTQASGGYPPSPDGIPADSSQMIPVMEPTEDSHYSPPQEPTTPDGKMADQPRSPVVRIAVLAPKIKAEAEQARLNKEECIKIATRLNKVSELLLQLEKTEMMKDPAMSRALRKLDETFSQAHMLITACQRSNIITMFLPWPAKKLYEQLHEVFDQMVLELNDVIAVGVRTIGMV